MNNFMRNPVIVLLLHAVAARGQDPKRELAVAAIEGQFWNGADLAAPALVASTDMAKIAQPKRAAAGAKYAQYFAMRGASTRTHLTVEGRSTQAVDGIIMAKLKASQTPIVKPNMDETHGHGAVNASANLTNAGVAKHQTRVLEEAVSTLPMASFALDVPQPVKNTTKYRKFPGNATQHAAFMKREKFLEDQIAQLKARLTNVSSSIDGAHGMPKTATARSTSKLLAATGTFNSRLDGNQHTVNSLGANVAITLVVSNVSAQFETIHAKKQPKAKKPEVTSVSALMALKTDSADNQEKVAIVDKGARGAAPPS